MTRRPPSQTQKIRGRRKTSTTATPRSTSMRTTVTSRSSRGSSAGRSRGAGRRSRRGRDRCRARAAAFRPAVSDEQAELYPHGGAALARPFDQAFLDEPVAAQAQLFPVRSGPVVSVPAVEPAMPKRASAKPRWAMQAASATAASDPDGLGRRQRHRDPGHGGSDEHDRCEQIEGDDGDETERSAETGRGQPASVRLHHLCDGGPRQRRADTGQGQREQSRRARSAWRRSRVRR